MSYDVLSIRKDCPTCALPFSLSDKLWDIHAAKGLPLYCPAGHAFAPKMPDEVSRLRSELAASLRDAAEDRLERDVAWNTIRHLEHVNAALRGYIKRLKRGAR